LKDPSKINQYTQKWKTVAEFPSLNLYRSKVIFEFVSFDG